MGLAFFSLVVIYVRHELSFDAHHPHADRIYRLIEFVENNGVGERSASMPYPFVEELQRQHPELIEVYVRIFNWQAPSHVLKSAQYAGEESRFYFADSTFFEVFDFPLIMGNPATAFDSAFSVIISQEAAQRYFGAENPLGKSLTYGDRAKLWVTGVVDMGRVNSHFQFDFLSPMSTTYARFPRRKEVFEREWVWNPFWTYVLLKEGKSPEELEFLLPDIVSEHMSGVLSSVNVYLQPLRRIHLYSDLDYELSANGNMFHLYIFLAIATTVVLLSVINFTNLTISRIAMRAKEIGVRKAIGADFSRLAFQFQVELAVMVLIAMVLAYVTAELALPNFFPTLGIHRQISANDSLFAVWVILLGGGGTALLSGIYPTAYLSHINAVETLQRPSLLKAKSKGVRASMILLQLVIILFLFNASIVVKRQYEYLNQQPTGFEREQIICLPIGYSSVAVRFAAFRDSLLQFAPIQDVTSCEAIPGVGHQTHEFTPNPTDSTAPVFFPSLMVGRGFVNTLGIQLVAGNDFSDDPEQIASQVLINKAMSEYLGFESPEQALGIVFRYADQHKKVVGIMENFHYESLREAVGPFLISEPVTVARQAFYNRYALIRHRPGQKQTALAHLKAVWGHFMPERPMVYFDLTDRLKEVYAQEQNLSRIASMFSQVALLIACLGLFGVSYFAMEQRKREVAIRKALGANELDAVLLLLGGFLRLALMAVFITLPVSWAMLDNWLDGYPYRIPLGLDVFLISGLIVVLMITATVAYHIFKTAKLQPMTALRQ